MLSSMTGYGRAEVTRRKITAVVELRSVNNRFLEVSARLPRSLSIRENDIKELIRRRIVRGKINATVTIDHQNGEGVPLRVNIQAAREVHRLLNELRRAAGLREKITLEHLLHFSEVIEQVEAPEADEHEWEVARDAIEKAVETLHDMRLQEGQELEKDFRQRIAFMEEQIARVEEMSRAQVPAERERLRARIGQLLESETMDQGRLELELALMADRLDVTEECVRFRSHTKFFVEAFADGESAGRKLNFLLQEMNRETNTIGSKSSSAEIAHQVVRVKEELEKIREQVQNIE